MDDDYKKEIDEIYKRLSAKNQEKLADLLAKQEEDEDELRETTKNLPAKVNSVDIRKCCTLTYACNISTILASVPICPMLYYFFYLSFRGITQIFTLARFMTY